MTVIKVKIYSTATCAYCKAEKAFLAEHNIPYEEVAVDTNPQAIQELQELSGQMGVPYTVITKTDGSEEKILGFDQVRLQEVLGI